MNRPAVLRTASMVFLSFLSLAIAATRVNAAPAGGSATAAGAIVAPAARPDAPAPIQITRPVQAAVPLHGEHGEAVSSVAFDLDRISATKLRRAGFGRITLPFPGRGDVQLDMERRQIFANGAEVTVMGPGGPEAVKIDLTMFRGTVEGDPDTWAVIGISGDMMVGSLISKDGVWSIVPPGLMKQDREHHRIINETDLPSSLQDATCGMLDDASRWPSLDLGKEPQKAPATTSIRLVCNVAVEADYDFFSLFGLNSTTATNYTAAVMATVSAIYERDINVTIVIPYMNFWGVVNDPYDQTDAGAQLSQFRTWWINNRAGVGRDVAVLFSGRSYASVAGIAYMNTLCNKNLGYAMVSITTPNESYPTNQVQFNMEVVAHELGHSFSSPHTHSCYWQSAGFVAPGALIDTCAVAEGTCNTSPAHPAFGKGTIMSYCQLQGEVNQTLRLDFHPACKTVMRAAAEASCFPAAVVQPPMNLTITTVGGVPQLNWNPSSTPGVTYYKVYASVYTFDTNPPLLDTTSVTHISPLPAGTYYFKVKAYHPSMGDSPFSAEARASGCSFTGTNSTVSLPLQSVTADFNEDGIPDLALVAQNPKVIAVMLGQGTGGVGNGTFATAVTYAAGPAPTNLATGDFNDDGITDLAVTSYASTAGNPGTLRILTGQGTGGVGNGTFVAGGSFTTGKDPTCITTGDFNEDGITDVATAGGFPGRVSVFMGQGTDGVGNGSFNTAVTYLWLSDRPKSIVTADLNNDGIQDLVVTYHGPSPDNQARVDVLMGQGTGGVGNGTFVEQIVYGIVAWMTNNVYDLSVADFNGDNIPDVAVACDTNDVSGLVGRVGVAFGLGDGTFALGNSYDAGGVNVYSLDVADFNQDGIADVVATNNEILTTPSAILMYGGGSGGVPNGMLGVPLRFGDGGAEGRKVLAGDFDEDGVPDVVFSLSARLSMMKSVCGVPATAVVGLTSPNGGEAWGTGENHTISWTKTTGVLGVDVQVSWNGGLDWETIGHDLPGTSFSWTVTPPLTTHARVRVLDATVTNRQAASIADFVIGTTSGVADNPAPPPAFQVAAAHPNPFRRSVALSVMIPAPGALDFQVLDVQGRVVRTQTFQPAEAGRFDVTWDGRSDAGDPAANGIYYARLSYAGRVVVRSVALVR